MKKLDVVGFGALNIDKLYSVNKIAYEDDEAFITNYNQFCGGSAANTVIGLSKLGINTGFIGKVSSDSDGMILIKNLKKEGVNTEGVIIGEDGRSGNVLGFVDKDGQRALYVDPGVNDSILPEEIKVDYLENTKVLHLTSFVGESIKAQEYILNEITDEVTVTLDPGRIYAEKGINFLKNILNRTDIILINEEELKHLTGNKYNTYEERARILFDYDIGTVIVKRGDKGSYITNGEENHLIKPFEVNCIDTTGAGDAFNAGFIYGLIKGEDILKCGQIGNLIASYCIQESGAIKGLPQLSEILKKNKILD